MRFLSVNENAFLIELDALETTIAGWCFKKYADIK